MNIKMKQILEGLNNSEYVNEAGEDKWDKLRYIVDQYMHAQYDSMGVNTPTSKWEYLDKLKDKIDRKDLDTNEIHMILTKMYPVVKHIVGDIDESMTTSNMDGGLGQPKTPHAFQGGRDIDKKKEKENATASSRNQIAQITRRNFEGVDRLYTDIIDKVNSVNRQLNEVSYTDFKRDESKTNKQKINLAIREVNQKLREVERLIRHSRKLKNEIGAGEDIFWKRTVGNFNKISERLIRLSNSIREFGR